MEFFFSGEYYNTLDAKGRIAFPSKLQSVLNSDELWITKSMGGDKALALYAADEWGSVIKTLQGYINMFAAKGRRIYRTYIAPAQKISIDKNGRILIPQSLRVYAQLDKDCVFLGMDKTIELWDAGNYQTYLLASENDDEIFEELSDMIKHSS